MRLELEPKIVIDTQRPFSPVCILTELPWGGCVFGTGRTLKEALSSWDESWLVGGVEILNEENNKYEETKVKPNIGDKFVVEIDEIFTDGDNQTLYRMKGFKSLVFDENGIEKLSPYKECECKCEEEHDGCEGCRFEYLEEGYPCNVCKNAFISYYAPKDGFEIQVGDEVTYGNGNAKVVFYVTRIFKNMNNDTIVSGIGKNGRIVDAVNMDWVTKTGEHVDLSFIMQ